MNLKFFIAVLSLFAPVAIRASNVLQPPILRKPKNEGKICFLTDVEGDLAYLHRYIELSECLKWTDEDTKFEIEFQNDHDLFIYGGDVTDKGTGSMQFLYHLVTMKEKYGDRVELILGNRDINKMRLSTELSPQALDLESSYSTTLDAAYWKPKNNITPKDWLVEKFGEDKCEENNTLANRIKWMLSITMGAEGDFERRRAEFQTMLSANVPDYYVTESYMGQVAPDGLTTQYLKLGKLAVIKHNTLFTHGGILGPKGSSLGHIPNQSIMDFRYSTLDQWVDGLNDFKNSELEKWVLESEKLKFQRHDFQLPPSDSRAGISLIQYAPTKGDDKPSVVVSRQLDKTGMPIYLDFNDVHTLAKFGIKTIVCGHTPHGNAPTIIPSISDDHKVTTILADTSYSNSNSKTQRSDPRGKAVSEVVIRPDGSYTVHGVLSDGKTRISYDNTDEWIGQELMLNEKKYIVLAKLENSSKFSLPIYTLMHVNGFLVEYLEKTASELSELKELFE